MMTSTKSNFFVPCVPISISANLVAAQPLAKRLAVSAPELAHLPLSKFASIQAKKSELRVKVDDCAMTQEALLDASVLNIGDLFSNLSAYLRAEGQAAENCENLNLQTNLQDSLKQLQAYAAAMDLVAADYCLDGEIHPEMLFVACLKRMQLLQKRWKQNSLQSIELALQLQTDAVYGAAASCLTDICEHGLENQIEMDPVPQVQEDALVAMAMLVDLPFSGEWPALKERVVSLGDAATDAPAGGAL